MMARRQVVAAIVSLSPMLCTGALAAPARWRRERVLATGLSSPVGMAIDHEGRLLVANWSAGTVTRITANGKASTIASGLNGPSGLALAANGDLFVASYSDDLVWKITRSGQRDVFVRGLGTPAGLSFDIQRRLLIANRRTNQILAADATGNTTVAVEGDLQTPVGAVQLSDGSYFVSNINGGVAYAGPDGRARTVSRDFVQPGPGIAIADAESVFVVDYGGTEVKQVHKDGRTRVVADGFRSPVGLVVSVDGATTIVADWGTNAAYSLRVVAK